MNYTNQLLENIRNIQHIFSFTDNMSHVNLADIQPISKYMRGIQFLLCTIDIYSKYAQVVSLKGKKAIKNTDAFLKISGESKRKKKKKHVQIKVVDFTVDQWSHGYKTTIQKFTQNKIKTNLFFSETLIRN